MRKLLIIVTLFAAVITELYGQTLTVSPATLALPETAGASSSFTITSDVAWTIIDNATWLTVAPASGSNNATITVTAEANPSASPRNATVTVSGTGVSDQTVTVTQNGAAASLTLSTTSVTVAAAANSTGTFGITSNTSWTVTDNASWLTVSPASGTDNATITVTAEANPSASPRSATVTVSGTGVSDQTVTVNQSGAAAYLNLSVTLVTIGAESGSSGSFNISSNTTWSISSNRSWITVTPTSGSNDGSITITANNTNTGTDPRNATLTITGSGVTEQTVTVTQNGSPASLSLSTTLITVAAAANSTGTFDITSNTSWTVAESETWLTVSATSGSNNATITVTATAANTSASTRSASVTVTGNGLSPQTVTVTQQGAAAYLNLSATSVSVAYTANSTGTFNITSNTAWTITDNASWLTVSPASGSNSSTITVTADANPSTSERTATVTIAGTGVSNQTVSVTQAGIPTYTVSVSANPGAGGTVSGGGTYASGTSVTINASAATGYQFVNWTEGGTPVSTNASFTFNLTSNRTLVANFSLLSYTISTSSSPVAGGTTNGGGTFSYGTSATITATPATGYQFVSWTQSGTVVSTSASYTFTVTANRILVANFSLLTYNISTASSPAAGGTTSGGGTLNYGATASVTATPATGYQFVNWTESGSVVSTNPNYSFTVNSNRSLLANFSLINYTVSTVSSPVAGGTTTGAGTYSYGSTATVTASPASGYLFVNWTVGGTVVSTNVNYSFTVTANRTVTANFNLITYTISTASNPAAGGTTSGGGTFNPGTSATVTATPASGYQFVSWTEGGTPVSTSPNYTFLVYANRALVATFQSINYITINTLSNPSTGGTATGGGTFTEGSVITVNASPSTGYRFVNWTENGSTVSSSESYTFTVTVNRTLVANFSPLTYTITTSSSPLSGGSTTGTGTYNYGTEVTVSATPGDGYQFVNWTQGGSSVSTNSSYTFTVTSNRTLVANFSQIIYTITTSSSPSNGGSTSGGGNYAYDQDVTVNAYPSGGYSFTNWTQGGSVVSSDESYTFSITSSRTLVANFSQITYSISTSSSPSSGGSTSGGGTYGSGSSATVTATPSAGYQFVNWAQGGSVVSTSASYTFTVTASRTLTANFTQAAYTISTSSSPATGGTTSGGGSFNYGASVTVTATPAAGYQFSNWTEGGTSVSNNLSYTFTVTSGRTLLANFSQIPRVLNLSRPGGAALQNNDVIVLETPDPVSLTITVEANADWNVTDNSVWLKAVKENNTTIRVTCMENISVINKQALLRVTTALNAEIQFYIQQKARVSQIYNSKYDYIKLYPNPASENAFLHFGETIDGSLKINIATIYGTVIRTMELREIQADQVVEIDIDRIPSGQYLLNISNKAGQKTLTLIIH